MKLVCALLTGALLCTACTTRSAALLELPLLPPGTLAVDATYRLEIRRSDDNGPRQWLLVLRDTPRAFAFEALDEFGMTALRWPLTTAADERSTRLAEEVARMAQLALAPPAVWQNALANTEWQFTAGDDGSRELRRGETVLLRASPLAAAAVAKGSPEPAPPGGLMSYCPNGFATQHLCRGDQPPTQIQVDRLPP